MRYNELIEASDLRPAELVKYVGKANDRVPIFLDKVRNQKPFTLKTGEKVVIDPAEHNRLAILLVPGVKGIPSVRTTDGQEVSLSALAKTGEFGAGGETATGERKIANRGNTMEGILGVITVARLAVRPGRDVSLEDVKKVVNLLAKQHPPVPGSKTSGGVVGFKSKDPEVNKVVDSFELTVKLPTENYNDLVDFDFMMKDADLAGMINQAIKYVNSAGIVGRFADYFEKNKRSDQVQVVADGVSDMSGRKADIFMVYTDENGERQVKKFDLSLKAGTTPQFGQASAGSTKTTSKQKAHGEFGWNAYQKIFGDFGIDISSAKDAYLRAKNLRNAVVVAYKTAFNQFKEQLAGSDDDAEKKWLRQFIWNIKEHGTYNDPNVQLLQFEKNKYYALDFKRLDRLFAQDKLDLDIEYIESSPREGGPGYPSLVFVNAKNPNEWFIKIRSRLMTDKMNNVIEKGPLLKKITKTRAN